MQIVFALLIVVFGLAFHLKNDTQVTLDFYVWMLSLPLSWLLVVTFSLGAVAGLLVMLTTIFRLQREIRRLIKKCEIASKEIVSLRAVSINDGR
tara:strand:+ start:154 stop:435 length:282 start_codon:yes stop_codon:yes gene_type:complete